MSNDRLLSEKSKNAFRPFLVLGELPHIRSQAEKKIWGSLEKIAAEANVYDNRLNDINDFAGVRIITCFPRAVDKIVS